ncbi:MAG: hypothetical protein ABJB74_23225 [Gemmatimonas sp.]
MTLYLLLHYWKPNLDIRENRTLLVLAMLVPMIVMVTWGFPGTVGVWAAAGTTAMLGAITPQRPTRFEAALPISGRDIAIARLVSAFAVNVTPILLATATIVAFNRAPFPAFELAASVFISVLAVLLPRLVNTNQLTVTAGGGVTPILVMGIAAGAAILRFSHAQSLALLSVSAVAVGAWWWRRVPEAFQLAPLSVSSRVDHSSDADVSSAADRTRWWHVIRTTMFSKMRVYNCALAIMMGAMGMWQLYLISVIMMEDVWQRARWMQSMPLSHRSRLWMLLTPGFFLPLLLTIIGAQLHIPGHDEFQSVNRSAIGTMGQESRYFDSPTSVSFDYWEQANGAVAPITAPWGETVQPYVIHVFNRTYYNPYTARKASSERFTAWQFERLTTSVFGVPLALKDHDDGQLNPRRLNAQPRMMILNVATALVIGFLFMIGMGFVRWHKSWAHQTIVGIVMVVFMVVPIGVWLFTIVAYGMRQGAMNVLVPLLERQLMNLSPVLPSNNFVVLAFAAVPVLAVYSLLEWQYKNSEMVGPVPKV